MSDLAVVAVVAIVGVVLIAAIVFTGRVAIRGKSSGEEMEIDFGKGSDSNGERKPPDDAK